MKAVKLLPGGEAWGVGCRASGLRAQSAGHMAQSTENMR
jgi:hypothetical protein